MIDTRPRTSRPHSSAGDTAAASGGDARTQPAPTVRIRPIAAADGPALERFYAELPEDDLRSRFLGAIRGLSHGQSVFFCTADHRCREGLVAEEIGATRPTRIVGHLCIEPDDRPGGRSAEVAIAVAVDRRRQGTGRRLVETGVAWARRHGVRELTATMLAGNAPVIRLLTGTGRPWTSRLLGDGTVAVRISIDPESLAA